ncbi:MAG: glycosyltransferase [Pseudomonadota bacterium]
MTAAGAGKGRAGPGPRAAGRAAGPAEAIFVLGMHRSGTSLLTEMLSHFGYRLPVDRDRGSRGNDGGHFEPQAIVGIHERLLLRAGSHWARLAPLREADLPPEVWDAAAAEAGAALRRSYGRARRIVLKDPRICLVWPLWARIVAAQGWSPRSVVALRRPAEAAASLDRRDGIAPDVGVAAWCAATLAALDIAAQGPMDVVLFPDWVGDAPGVLSRLAAHLGLPQAGLRRAETALDRTFRPDLVHQGARAAGAVPELAAVAGKELAAIAGAIFALARDAAGTGTPPPAGELAALAAAFGAATDLPRRIEAGQAALLRHALFAEPPATGAANAAAGALAQDADARAGRARFLDRAARLARGEVRRARALLARTESQRDTLAAALAARTADAGLLAGQVRATESQRDRLQADLEECRTGAAGLARQVAATEVQRDDLAARLASETARRAGAEADLDAVSVERVRLGAETAALSARLAALARDLADAERRAGLARQEAQRLAQALDLMTDLYRKERMTVLKPLYRRFYSAAGSALRRHLPERTVEMIKRRVPGPGGIPAPLAFASPPPPPAPDGPPAPAAPLPAADRDRPDIFMFSIIDWTFRTQRPQHLAREMARRGHRVFYVEMEREAAPTRVSAVAPGVWTVRLATTPGGPLPAYSGVPGPAQVRHWLRSFGDFCDGAGATPIRHAVVQHPYWWNFVRHLAPDTGIVFDCMDELSGFSNTAAHMIAAEEALAGAADTVLVSSDWLARKHGARRPVTLLRNAADTGHFAAAATGSAPLRAPAWLRPVPGTSLRVGYVGAIAEWFDTDLVEATAGLMPDAEFHLCGAVSAEAPLRLSALPNVVMHGEIPYADVPGFLAGMDVMTIPFRLLPIIRACDPVKFYEHSAAGRPTVATHLPELDRAGDLVFRAEDPQGFAAAIRQAAALGREAAFRDRLRDYARANTWSERADAALAAIVAAPRVSVVILSYGDPELTMGCVHGLVGVGRTYPDLDILVVDNGSGVAELSRLRRYLGRFPEVRLIENGRNLGFAAGNNIGIAAARGDYVMLLNNDTYVAPGAVAAMVRHLARDPGIGVIGPLTNAIGNEARVEVGYRDMDEMVRVARRLAEGHRGQSTEVRVCAYFCAMFRRRDLAVFGPLSEDYGQGMFEDDDHCARIRAAGFRCAIAEDAFVHHQLSATFGTLPGEERQRLFDRNRALYEARWGAWQPHRYRARRPASTFGEAA